MEVQLVIQRVMLDTINTINIPGEQAEQYAQQKSFISSSLDLNRITIANLKKLIKEEEKNG